MELTACHAALYFKLALNRLTKSVCISHFYREQPVGHTVSRRLQWQRQARPRPHTSHRACCRLWRRGKCRASCKPKRLQEKFACCGDSGSLACDTCCESACDLNSRRLFVVHDALSERQHQLITLQQPKCQCVKVSSLPPLLSISCILKPHVCERMLRATACVTIPTLRLAGT